MKIKWKILTLLTLVLTALYMLLIPYVINLPSNREFLADKIYNTSGIKVDLGNAKVSMGLFPFIWVKSDKVTVVNKDGSIPLYIYSPKIKFNPIPLIFKRISIPRIEAKKENIDLVLTKDKVFMLGDYPLNFKSGAKLKLDKINLELGEYNLKLDDRLNHEHVRLSGEYVKDTRYHRNKKIKLKTKGGFAVGDNETPFYADVDMGLPVKNLNNDKLKLNAGIKDFNLSFISDYVNIFTNGLIKDLKGTLNFSAETIKDKSSHKKLVKLSLDTKNLEVIGVDKPSSVVHKKPLRLYSEISAIKGGAYLKNTSLTGEGLKVTFDGKLSDSGKIIPAMDFVVEIKPSKLESACALLPWIRTVPSEMDFYKFKQYGAFGMGEGKMHFKGKGERPEVFGYVKLSGVYAMRKGLIAPEGASVDMDFKGQKMFINVFVPAKHNQTVTVKGFVKLDGSKYSELDIDTTDSVVMEEAQVVLNPLHEMLKFKIGPVPIMKIKGLGELHVQSRGKKVDPHLWGKMTFRKATAEFTRIHNLVLNNGSGEIIFDDRNISFRTLGGTINGRPTSIYGKCNVFGNLDVFAETKNQNIPDMIKVIMTSEDMKDVQKVVKPFTQPKGLGDLYLNIYGNAKDVTHVAFNKDIFAKGRVVFHNASTVLKDTYLPLKNIKGEVTFDKKDAKYELTGNVRNSVLDVKGSAHDKNIDLTAKSQKFRVIDLLDMMHQDPKISLKKELGNLFVSFTGGYKGAVESGKIQYDKVFANGHILSNRNSSDSIKVYNGDFNLKNGAFFGKNFKGDVKGNPYTISFTADDIYNNIKIKSADFNLKDFDISVLNDFKGLADLDPKTKKIVDNVTDLKGRININGNIKNGGIYSNTDLKNLSFTYKSTDAVLKILSGSANMRGDTLYLSRVNSRLASMPVYLNGRVSNVLTNPNANLYISGKFNQEFFDKFINAKSLYPVKLKGDANFVSKINGTADDFHTNTSLNVAENSSIYYMGATLAGAPTGLSNEDGVATNPVSLVADVNVNKNNVKINSFDYNQTISSQNKKNYVQNQLKLSGGVSLLKNNILKFNNLKIKTFAPTDAKIFNIVQKKPAIKQGVFTSDVIFNGTSLRPKAKGKLNISSIDMPLLDATIRDIDVNFKDDYVYLNSKGVILTNDISLMMKIVNNPNPPYIIDDMTIKTDVLDLNIVANRFNDYDTDKLKSKQVHSGSIADGHSPDSVIIKNGRIKADTILIKKAQASDLNVLLSVDKDGILRVHNFVFDLANGRVSGDIVSNLNNFVSTANMKIQNADAQIIAENFFDLNGQVYGIVTGDLTAKCKGISGVECMNTLSGSGKFEVIDGRMPKLGSLEYLLKAANLVTGGIGAVSINGIIDLITPLKTGNFEKINGDVTVHNGVATDINVYSSGKELNMYLTGSYDFSTLVADMEVYGSLSKNFSTLLGLIGNASLNRLLNTIPGININEIKPESSSNINKIPNFDINNTLRVFKAEILGDINGTNYVKSFKWINH